MRLPGTVLVCADSHTCAGGAFNCAARGVGGPDMIYAAIKARPGSGSADRPLRPRAAGCGPASRAKDVFLHIAGTFGDHANQNVEFGGPGMRAFGIDARRTIAAMGAELSAEFAIFEADDIVLDYVRDAQPAPFTPHDPDADATMPTRRTIDLGTDRAPGRAARLGV